MKFYSYHGENIGDDNGHDPNAAFLDVDKQTILHIEEERISRIKKGSTSTSRAHIYSILEDFNPDITIVIANSNVDRSKIVYRDFVKPEIKDNKCMITHHLAHASYGYYTRPEEIDKCDILSYDGWGWESDFYFYNEDLELVDLQPKGLGLVWTDATRIGFKDGVNDVGKFMGLSAYGKVDPNIISIIDKYRNDLISLSLSQTTKNERHNLTLKSENEYMESLKNFDYKDVAATIQKYSIDFILSYLEKNKTSDSLVISGGIGLNGYINQVILDRGLYKHVHIGPATSDSGLSVGAVLFAANMFDKPLILREPLYLGRDFTIPKQFVDNLAKEHDLKISQFNEDYIADKIISGKIIGLFQGRSESGPRALGNRSILCDPRSGLAKEYLNKNVKYREWFRPYAPAILKEHVHEWFENIDEAKYMNKIAKYKPGKGELVAGTCHIDYTGRLQTVTKESNPKYYSLIEAFYKKTSIPILLNTSFNRQEPIVDSPIDAVTTFLKNDIDILILEDFILEKAK